MPNWKWRDSAGTYVAFFFPTAYSAAVVTPYVSESRASGRGLGSVAIVGGHLPTRGSGDTVSLDPETLGIAVVDLLVRPALED